MTRKNANYQPERSASPESPGKKRPIGGRGTTRTYYKNLNNYTVYTPSPTARKQQVFSWSSSNNNSPRRASPISSFNFNKGVINRGNGAGMHAKLIRAKGLNKIYRTKNKIIKKSCLFTLANSFSKSINKTNKNKLKNINTQLQFVQLFQKFIKSRKLCK